MKNLYLEEKKLPQKPPQQGESSTGAAKEISEEEIKKFEESIKKLEELKEQIEKRKKN